MFKQLSDNVSLVPGVLVLACFTANVSADTITVCWDGGGDYVTIQEGIDAAGDGDEVVVCDGVYTGPGNKDLDFGGKAITVRSAGGPDNCTIDCEGVGRGFDFHNGESLSAVLQGFTITNGYVLDDGGAILCRDGSSPTIRRCDITDNSSAGDVYAFGGGIHCWNGSSPVVSDCTIAGNVAAYAGGGIAVVGAAVQIRHCDIRANTAYDRGGAIYCRGGSVLIDDSTVRDSISQTDRYAVDMLSGSMLAMSNCAIANNVGGGVNARADMVVISGCAVTGNAMDAGYGAGLGCNGRYVRVVRCMISGNSAGAGEGGGLSCGGDDLLVVACAVIGNSAAYAGGVRMGDGTMVDCWVAGNVAVSGGGLGCAESDARIVNCTITANAATGDGSHSGGGGVHCFRRSNPTISNAVLWNNAAQQGAQIALTGASGFYPTLSVNYSDVQGGQAAVFVSGSSALNWGAGNIESDPLFIDPDNGDCHLLPGSPCIDAGCNWAVPADVADLDDDGDVDEFTPFDLDGEGRFFDDPDTPDTGRGCPPIVDMGAYEFGGTGPQPCLGDLDCDRTVGESDLAILLAAWGDSAAGDLNCDGVTDHSDLGVLLAVWGQSCP